MDLMFCKLFPLFIKYHLNLSLSWKQLESYDHYQFPISIKDCVLKVRMLDKELCALTLDSGSTVKIR